MIELKNINQNFSDFFIAGIEKFSADIERPKSIGVSWSQTEQIIKLHFSKNPFDKNEKSINQFEYQDYAIAKYSSDPTEKEHIPLWRMIRSCTKKAILPTVVLYIVDKDLYDFPIETDTEIFGRAVIKHIRDYTMGYHSSKMERFKGKTKEDIIAEYPKNWTDEMRATQIKDAEFFTSLDSIQIEFLNDYILGLIDNIGFNVMRAIDESSFDKDCKSIEVKVNNTRAENLNMIGNGNLSGEYFDWIERFSKFKALEL